MAPRTFGSIRLHQRAGDKRGRLPSTCRRRGHDDLPTRRSSTPAEGVPLIVIAARIRIGLVARLGGKGARLWAWRAVIARELRARIHRSNLVAGDPAAAVPPRGERSEPRTDGSGGVLDLTARRRTAAPVAPHGRGPRRTTARSGDFEAIVRLDGPIELGYYRQGGILPAVLRRLARGDGPELALGHPELRGPALPSGVGEATPQRVRDDSADEPRPTPRRWRPGPDASPLPRIRSRARTPQAMAQPRLARAPTASSADKVGTWAGHLVGGRVGLDRRAAAVPRQTTKLDAGPPRAQRIEPREQDLEPGREADRVAGGAVGVGKLLRAQARIVVDHQPASPRIAGNSWMRPSWLLAAVRRPGQRPGLRDRQGETPHVSPVERWPTRGRCQRCSPPRASGRRRPTMRAGYRQQPGRMPSGDAPRADSSLRCARTKAGPALCHGQVPFDDLVLKYPIGRNRVSLLSGAVPAVMAKLGHKLGREPGRRTAAAAFDSTWPRLRMPGMTTLTSGFRW